MKRKIYSYLLSQAIKRTAFGAKLAKHGLAFHKAYENNSYDFISNGENSIMEVLERQEDVKMRFDVGTNIGEWSILMGNAAPNAELHAFEIVPCTFNQQERLLSDRVNVHRHNIGMSDVAGIIDVFVSDKNDLTTCAPGHLEDYHGRVAQVKKCEVTTGDLFCQDHGVDHIDFLKMDVEGFEGKVLSGFEGMLKAGKVRVIQFEYGYSNLAAHLLLKDIYNKLDEYDMIIGKIYPEGVEFRDYHFSHENFYGANYIAIKKCESEMISQLERFQ